MEQMLDKIKSGEVKHLPVIIKADVQGAIEAIEATITKLANVEVSGQILHSAVGPISDSDVTLAKASNACIIGFNVRAIPHARDMARQDGVDIRYYSIIYDVADDIKKALEGMFSPELKEKIFGYAEIRNAVVSMKLGARDYVSKPVQPDELLRKIREALDAPHPETAMPASAAMAPAPAKPRRKGDRALDEGELNYIEGHSDASRKLYEYVRLVAPTNMSVLLEGASGTGKEHVARLIHLRSKRAGKPFVAVDCGALSRELAASEFSGHIKGSFTGALSDKKGAFESAQGGTLFLDEVGNLSYEVQIQLLRALQERRIKPVGG